MPKNNKSKRADLINESAIETEACDPPSPSTSDPDGDADAIQGRDHLSGKILNEIRLMKEDFSLKLNGLLAAVDSIKGDIRDISGRLTQAETRISDAEDNITTLQSKTGRVDKDLTALILKVDELENRNRRSNLRLIGLPEGTEGRDAALFLETWLPEVLGSANFPSPLIIERAHRLTGPKPAPDARPRALIMKFLNFRDKERVLYIARNKGRVMYENHHVMFFPDLSADLHKQRRQFDGIKQELRAMDIRYGLMFPAKLRVTFKGQTHIFESPSAAEVFLKKIKRIDV